jgi:membrane fusion protein (multidrug efflux system)
LPPDNASGNFIHIVERVPVRIALQKDEIMKNPIRPGLSTMTSINVKESDQPLGASLTEVSSPEYGTDIYVDELADAQTKAQKIIMDNLVQKGDSSEPMCKSSESGAAKNSGVSR